MFSMSSGILLITALTSFLTAFSASSINVALSSIGKDFSVSSVTLNWISTSFILATAIFLLFMSRIADNHGRKRIFVLGISIYTLSSFAGALVNSAVLLIVFRAITGIGAAMLFATAQAILVNSFAKEKRGKVLGINVAMVYLGASMGPFIGGIITSLIGWRMLLGLPGVLGVFLIVLIFRTWKFDEQPQKLKLDIVGTLLYAVGLLTLLLGFTKLPNITGITLLLIGIAALTIFILWERKYDQPLLTVSLFTQNRIFALSNLSAMISYCATFAVSFFISLYLQEVMKLSPFWAGLILVMQPLFQALFSPFCGKLSDKIEPRYLSSVGMGLTTLALAMMILLNESTPLIYLITALALLGFAFALFSSPNTNAIMSSVENRYLGIASALTAVMRVIGQMFSMGIALILFSVILGSQKLGPENVQLFLTSQRAAFIIFALLCFLGIFASMARGKVRK